MAHPHAQSAWGSRGERIRAAELAACCNYLSKKKEENQPYDSPQVHLNKQPAECVTRPTVITKGKDEHEVDHGNFKTKEDIEVVAMGHSKRDC